MSARLRFFLLFLGAVALVSLGASCETVDRRHQVIISVPEQRMALLQDGAPLATYPVSTSKFGLGDLPNTCWTPLGRLEIAKKIGGRAPSGAAFKNRRPTGENIPQDTPGHDIHVSRVLRTQSDRATPARGRPGRLQLHPADHLLWPGPAGHPGRDGSAARAWHRRAELARGGVVRRHLGRRRPDSARGGRAVHLLARHDPAQRWPPPHPGGPRARLSPSPPDFKNTGTTRDSERYA